ncbi:hypothetical protein B1R32_106156 [Abditibacterium utsteinense]|uniref:Uncharacterized protein n=1 Tax=Abditibacterium utsteinense TaxID=1960156 RepID=A0A2S8SU49_9BACT|nr:hypothetical protein [Abditibacterium utsteinense]PQV64310.1 hypothetical protein B1R32_106156 [Abditibacterium utsteinense]
MIKTVAFAPPRAANSRSIAKTSGAKPELKPVLATSAPRPTSDASASGSSLSSGSSAAKPRAKKPSAKTGAQTSLDLFSEASDEPSVASFVAQSEVEKPRVVVKTTKNQAKSESQAEVETEAKPELKAKAEVKAKTEVKAKKVRVPKDLAAQYGEKISDRPASLSIEPESPKKRLTKVERQARRDLIKPSEGLMERLARANQISLRKPPSEPRGKGWKFACGRCGAISYFQTPGGLCTCGTIAVKE